MMMMRRRSREDEEGRPSEDVNEEGRPREEEEEEGRQPIRSQSEAIRSHQNKSEAITCKASELPPSAGAGGAALGVPTAGLGVPTAGAAAAFQGNQPPGVGICVRTVSSAGGGQRRPWKGGVGGDAPRCAEMRRVRRDGAPS